MDNSNQSFQRTQCPLCLTVAHDRLLYPASFTQDDLNNRVFASRRTPDRVHYRTVRCRQCGIVRGAEVLIAQALSALYAQSQSNDPLMALAAARTYGKYFRKYFPQMSHESVILEVGCGRGFFLEWLMQQGFTHIKGVEPSQSAIEESGARKQFIHQGMFEGSCALPASVDMICAFHLFDHLLDPAAFLKTVKSLLKSQGKLMMVMHDI